MPLTLDPELRRALAERVRYCHEMGIYDFYRRDQRLSKFRKSVMHASRLPTSQSEVREEMAARKSAVSRLSPKTRF